MQVASKAFRIAKEPSRAWDRVSMLILEWYSKARNSVLDLGRRNQPVHSSGMRVFDEICEHSRRRSDINDHLPTIFAEALAVRPHVIVELGVRGGESTRAFERIAALCDSTLVSVDIDDCSRVSNYAKRWFVKCDDTVFATQFEKWCRDHQISPAIDVLFIDTSHEREHTVQEVAGWFPFLAERSKVFFHDTHMKKLFRRRDGSLGVGWDNQRGVISAIEDRLGCRFDETRDFTTVAGGFMVKHYASCNGLTVLEKLPVAAVSNEVGQPACATV
jgi:hypothetical protein